MPGIEHDGNIGVARGLREIADHAPQIVDAEIAVQLDLVETGRSEQAGDGGRVIGRIRQLLDVAIRRIADHQRNALVRMRVGARHKAQREPDQKLLQPAHGLKLSRHRDDPILP